MKAGSDDLFYKQLMMKIFMFIVKNLPTQHQCNRLCCLNKLSVEHRTAYEVDRQHLHYVVMQHNVLFCHRSLPLISTDKS